MERIVGIDLATEPERTGVVVLSIGRGRAVASLPPRGFRATDASVSEMVGPATVVGLDAPLGWPEEFVRAMVEHDAMAPWPTFGEPDPAALRRLLSRRLTDRFVQRQAAIIPLSVSADRIGAVAMRGAALQTAWSAAWGAMAPRDGSGPLVETYPAAALKLWGLPHRGYKGAVPAAGRPGAGGAPLAPERTRRHIVGSVVQRTAGWLAFDDRNGSVVGRAVASDHTLDALVSALVAAAAKAGRTDPPPGADAERARREGWIHLPTCSLQDIGAPLAASAAGAPAVAP